MAVDRRTVPYGEPALHALRAAIDRVQAGDPLAPVTVLVHSNAVGVAARRWLAAHGGIAAAQFLTAFRFAELLGGPSLAAAGRRPVSTPVVDVAVRTALQSSDGVFRPIAGHQATITAVRDTYRELRHVPRSALDELGRRGSTRAREVVRLCAEVQQALRGEWYDEADLLRAAARNCAAAPPRTVVFLPQRLRSTEQHLLDALAEHGRLEIITGAHEPPHPASLEVVDVSDADEEAREAVRVVAAAAHDGTPLHRIAVLWPRTDPYARLVGEHLDEAGMPWNGRSGVALHERLAARLVLDLFRLDRRGIRRADLFALLSHVPARMPDGATPVPRQRWERLSRDAALAGDDDWHTRLPAYAESMRARAAVADEGAARHWLDEAATAVQMEAFVAELRTRLGPAAEAQTWEHWSSVAHLLVRRWLGGHTRISRLPADEFAAYEHVQAALDRLGRLDTLAGPVTRSEFADTLEAELDGAPGRAGHIGTGVHIGPLSFAVGHTFDLVVVLGACEGVLPAPPPPEALLADHDRLLTGGALALDADLTAEQQHQLWAALSGADRAVVVLPRGDLRATAERQPTRWLPELIAAAPTTTRSVPSFAAGIADSPFPVTLSQHRVRALSHSARAGEPFESHPLVQAVEPLSLGAAMVAARRGPLFTEYDGDLSGLAIDAVGGAPISPTRLEKFVECPFGWFMHYVLGIEEVEQPDEQLQITPRDRGTLVHESLDRFHRAVVEGRLPQPGVDGWSDIHRDALLAAFAAAGDELAAQGAVGRTAFWRSEQARQRHELVEWLRRDSALVAERRAQVVASEHRFGMQGAEPAVIPLPTGEQLRLRGSADRIDRCADGTLVVTDHKTGSDKPYKSIGTDDPTASGTKFQLAGYAAAALAEFGPEGERVPVLAEYGFLAKGGHQRIGAVIDEAAWPDIARQLAALLAQIRTGLFFARPEKSQFRRSFVTCPYCDPDGLGTAERWTEFERKQHDPRTAVLLGVDTE